MLYIINVLVGVVIVFCCVVVMCGINIFCVVDCILRMVFGLGVVVFILILFWVYLNLVIKRLVVSLSLSFMFIDLLINVEI